MSGFVSINDEMYKKFEEDMQPQRTIRYFEWVLMGEFMKVWPDL